ncbi:threonine dehydrogenase-like Zn-dependent dehydrogenase [Cohnella sp. SGD-V74]|uniref:MDR/zinc-dependent alcohol dehydrogenase-like family protein n=1 Tax=unclassified Cohnella TaxID=2636738 RepID=UPI000D42C694|nr:MULTISPECIES: zinc-binding dehydrogenase [unclassified Cohnella]PRX71832.1 threonine dehydrogenase-like Zn-dependent dehydrogenase [Cohnella sp. SGD-V74]
MKAAALTGFERIQVFEAEKPAPGPGEIRVRVAACGVCSSELGLWANPAFSTETPLYFGHEISGIVEETGAGVERWQTGDRVTVFAERGGYAEYVVVPESWAIRVADGIPLRAALGEPIGCAMNAAARSGIGLGDTVVLIGAGFMGALVLQGARLRGAAKVIAVDAREESLALARRLGADETILAGREDVAERVRELTGGAGADVAIECTGLQAGLDAATQVVRIRGKLVVVGYHQGGPRSIDMQIWNWKGLDVVNAHEREPEAYLSGIRAGMKLLEAGRLEIAPLLTHEYPLERIDEAFRDAKSKPPGFTKAVIVF